MDEDIEKKESKWQKIMADYGPYIDDLWKKVYHIVIFFVIIFAIGFFASGYVIKHIINLLNLSNVTLITTSPFQFLNLAIDMGLFLSFLFTLPLLVWSFYSFLRPAVSKSEFRSLIGVLPASLILFLCGFVYGFFALYLGFQALAKINISYGLQNYWSIGLFISELFVTSSLLGALFQFPIIMLIIVRLKIISRDFLKAKRRLAYAIITVVVAMLPPTDGLSMLIMILPFIAMYEFVILFAKPVELDRGNAVQIK